jgi:hypothetical protein
MMRTDFTVPISAMSLFARDDSGPEFTPWRSTPFYQHLPAGDQPIPLIPMGESYNKYKMFTLIDSCGCQVKLPVIIQF